MLCIYIYVYVCTYLYMLMYTHSFENLDQQQQYLFMRICTCVCIYVHIYMSMYINSSISMYIYSRLNKKILKCQLYRYSEQKMISSLLRIFRISWLYRYSIRSIMLQAESSHVKKKKSQLTAL